MSAFDADVVVIGAGPAGSSAAYGLAERGLRTLIVEARTFPRAKVCGEYISPAATACLERMVSAAELERAGARREDRFVLEVGEEAVEWRMPRAAWTLSRAALDELLLRRAMDAGAMAMTGVGVRAVDYEDERVRVVLANGEERTARIVVHADGTGRLDPAGAVAHRRGVVGHKCHLRATIDGLRMRSAPGAYIGAVGVERGMATCALVARSEVVRAWRGDLDAMIEALWPAYRRGQREGEWMSCPVPGAPYTAPGHARSFRVGNAAAGVEPVGGEGIGLALWSGLRLAEVVEFADLVASQRRLGRMFRARLRGRRWGCRMAGEALLRPRLVRAALPLLRAPAISLRPAWRLTGKPV